MSTKIEWTDESWNAIRGCSIVSDGCRFCYAMRQAHRFSGPGGAYEGLTRVRKKSGPVWTGKVLLVPEKLGEPLRWRKPRLVFVNSMSDLFHEGVPFEFIAAIFGVMAATPQHTFQVLTKRPERALEFFAWLTQEATGYVSLIGGSPLAVACIVHAQQRVRDRELLATRDRWPLPNVHLGVSVENQATADERIPVLLELPAALRWISYEPALGPVDFGVHHRRDVSGEPIRRDPLGLEWERCDACGKPYPDVYWGDDAQWAAVVGTPEGLRCPACFRAAVEKIGESPRIETLAPSLRRLDWIVVGGESGPGARPFDLAWARSTIEQCKAAGVPVFVKQLGALARCSVEDVSKQRRVHRKASRDGPGGWFLRLKDRKGGDWSEWPQDLRVREFPRSRTL